MNKRIFITFAAFLGIISVFMPWIKVGSYSINAVSKRFNDGYFFAGLLLVILFLSFWQVLKERNDKKWDITVGVLSLINLLILFVDILSNRKILKFFGASFGIGTYIFILVSIFICGFVLYLRYEEKNQKSFHLDGDSLKEMGQMGMDAAQKGFDAAKKIGKSIGTATMNVAGEIKNELQKKNNGIDAVKPKYCAHCGAKVEEDSKFCQTCGNSVK